MRNRASRLWTASLFACWLISFAVVPIAIAQDRSVDLAIDHVEVTQGLQDSANSIPLVIGKPTVVRAFPRSVDGSDTVEGVTARLLAHRNNVELPGSPIVPDNGPIEADSAAADRLSANDSLNFTLQPDWYSADTMLTVELVLPRGTVDPNLANNRQSFDATYTDRSGLSIQYVTVNYTHANWTGMRRPRDRVTDQSACDFLRSIYPADPLEVTYDPWSPVEIMFGDGASSGELDADALITELNTLFASNPNPPDRLYAWTPESSVTFNGLSDPLWTPGGQNRVALGNDTGSDTSPPSNSRWRRTFAHEIGHNTHATGLFHTSRRLQGSEFGFDCMAIDPFNRVVMRKYPSGGNDLYDFMRGGEVEPHAWIAPPHYQTLFDFLAPAADTDLAVADAVPQAVADEASELMVVRGRVTRDGKGEFFPFYRMPANDSQRKLANRNPGEGTHSIRFLTAEGEIESARISWTPDYRVSRDSENDQLDSRSFTWFIEPLEQVTKVELHARGSVLDTLEVEPTTPEVSNVESNAVPSALNDPQQRELNITWEAKQPGTANSSAELTHQVYFSADNGATWRLVASGLKEHSCKIKTASLPGGDSCLFQIRSTDGYNVAVSTGKSFRLQSSLAKPNILAPSSGRVYREGAGVLLVGRAYDVGRGKLDARKLEWISNIQGSIGKGEKLVVRDLKVGSHTISLRVQGEEAPVDSITIEVKTR